MTANENTFFCIDMKTFYASVECAERGLNPFETNLVVADLTRGKDALCLAISPKMKAQGVKNRCRLSDIPDSIKYDAAPHAVVHRLCCRYLRSVSQILRSRRYPCVLYRRIHDYFFAKALDKVRPGGIIAFVTSSGTMDKKNPAVRKYIAQRADLLGAIRLPNNAFLANAGTGVVADILFLQKRDRPIEAEPDWVHLGKTENGYTINQYFVDNPDMVLGTLTEENTQYGKQEVTVKPIAGADLSEQLADAVANIHAEISEYERDENEESTVESIPADPNVRNFSFTLVDGDIYFRENSIMNKVELSITAQNRIKGMIKIRDCTRKLIVYQLEGYPDEVIEQEQKTLNTLYDDFTAKYGLINSRGNNMAFSDDASYCLLCSLEVIDENGALERKADMFTKRTIRQQQEIDHVDTAAEALAISLAEKARVDLGYMSELTGKTEDVLEAELAGVVFRDFGSFDPKGMAWAFFDDKKYPLVPADEFLSGNVRSKLHQVTAIYDMLKSHTNNAELLDRLRTSVEALQKVQPQDLTAGEIDVRLGATWIPESYIQQFMEDLLKPSYYASSRIKVHFSPVTAEWNISNKNSDYGNVTANVTYGTKRINGYKIIEETLNLKDVRIFDTIQDENGNDKRVLNKKETILAQQKQQLIKDAFRDWIWQDHQRREKLTALYNEKFNSMRPREYDGSHINFVGMNPAITLRPHQVNAIARVLYGGNTLLAHVVGAGKTFEMVAAAMESKRLGLCQKSLFVVPNHLTEQWAAEFLQLYPSANILVSTRKDFETRNRRKFCSRIATGDYDAVIIGHSQFEKIPVSIERQRAILEEQLDEIMDGISEAKRANAERFTIKQMEKSRKAIKLKLDKLNSQSRKDDVVTFEELGVDRLFVDEAHGFKNLFLYTKMRNVAGLSQTEAQKSSDLFMKCRYMDELTGNRGIVFATGTPISNSMTEMYTMQRYLEYDLLKSQGLQHFDCWASTFGETITAIELAPEGTGYRAKTRFARFYNLPELISMFKQVADVQTADMLRLPIPEAEYHNEVINHRQLVWGINCTSENARREMMAVKRQFHKEDGTIAYHGYQSFMKGEVSPELAHQIGIRLATQLWGDRYQVLVATHLDKESHLHNHFVINTVSFVDGIKFHRTKGDYRQMQIVSDALCKEYGLSVIEKPMGRGKHYLEYQAEKTGKPTWKTYIRDDVDAAIRSSMTFQQFVRNMRERGYAIERRATTLRLLPPGRERFVRFDTLGESYTEDAIISRILKQQKREHPPKPIQPVVRKAKVYGDFRLSKITWKGLRALYFFYLRKLRETQRQPAGYAPYILREDLRLMDAISEQSKFVFRHKLDSAEQVDALKSSLLTQVQALTAERTQQRNLKRRQGVSEREMEQIDTRISELSNQLKSLRKEIKLCDSVIERSLLIQAKNEQLKILKGKEQEKNEPAKEISMEIANMRQPESRRRVYTVKEIAEILGISKNAAYDLVKSNGFVIVRIGKTIRVPIESFDEWLNNR